MISEFNFEDLPPMKREFTTHFSNVPYTLRPEDDGKFSTLKELFEIANNKLINIDLKNANEEMVHKVNQLIKDFNREHLTIWGSMFPKAHSAARRINPTIPCFFSGGQVMLIYALYYTGLLFLYPLPGDVFLPPLITHHQMITIAKRLQNLGGCKAFFAKMAIVIVRALIRNSKSLYRHLRARGVIVIVWVINEYNEFEEALEYCPELDGVMTDNPSKLREFALNNNRKYQ